MPVVDVKPNLFNRRHPTYEGLRAHWDFVEATYQGGRGWFDNNIFKRLFYTGLFLALAVYIAALLTFRFFES